MIEAAGCSEIEQIARSDAVDRSAIASGAYAGSTIAREDSHGGTFDAFTRTSDNSVIQSELVTKNRTAGTTDYTVTAIAGYEEVAAFDEHCFYVAADTAFAGARTFAAADRQHGRLLVAYGAGRS